MVIIVTHYIPKAVQVVTKPTNCKSLRYVRSREKREQYKIYTTPLMINLCQNELRWVYNSETLINFRRPQLSLVLNITDKRLNPQFLVIRI